MRVANPPAKPLLIFDGDCNFCRRWITRWQRKTGDRIEYRPSQAPSIRAQFPEIPSTQFAEAVVLVEPDGAVFVGAAAVFRARGWWWIYDRIPGLRTVSERAYRVMARCRSGPPRT